MKTSKNPSSKLFRSFDPKSDANKPLGVDIEFLSAVPFSKVERLASFFPEMAKKDTDAAIKSLNEKVQRSTALTPIQINTISRLGDFILRSLNDPDNAKDSAEDWERDIVLLGIASPKAAKSFRRFADLLSKKIAHSVNRTNERKAFEAGVFPSFVGLGTTLELRAVLKEKFKWGTNIKKYDPQIVEVIPIVSVRLRVDSGTPETFCFQANAEEVSLIIDSLTACLKESEKLASYAKKR